MFDFLETGGYYKVLDNKLILNNATYKKGDSIFGYAEIKIQRGYGTQPKNIQKKEKGILKV